MSENTQSNAAADQAPAPKAPKAPNTATASRPAAAGRERPEGAPADDVHEVKKGETLEEIAEAHKTTAAELQRVNAIKKPELIWPGMQLRFR